MPEPRPITLVGPPTAEDQRAKREALKLWQADRGALIYEWPFLATLAMHLELIPVVDGRVDTACTDGEAIYVNPHLLRTMHENDRMALLAHEAWHCALGHIGRRQGRDPELWNVAVDHEVNALVQHELLELPEGWILFPEWIGEAAEQVYARLADALAADPRRGDGPDLDRGPQADLHLPDDLAELVVRGKVDPDFRPGYVPDLADRWRRRLVAAAQRHGATPGAVPGDLLQRIRELRRPAVPWQRVLRQFATRGFGGRRRWLPPARRHVHRGLYLPSRHQEQVRLTVALDTSGSTVWAMPALMSELVGVVAGFGRYELTVIQCDVAIRSIEVYSPERPLVVDSTRAVDVYGGGGTAFAPVFDRVAEGPPPDALIFLTDGYADDAPERAPGYPVLWALCPYGEPPTKWGQVVRLPADAD